jgi:hypothetical protein
MCGFFRSTLKKRGGKKKEKVVTFLRVKEVKRRRQMHDLPDDSHLMGSGDQVIRGKRFQVHKDEDERVMRD